MNEARRYPEIDALKAAGIATIILIHCVRAPWDPLISPLEIWLGHMTRFGVPAFLMASGFLYAGGPPAGLATTARRLRRILVPYLIASLAAQVWWAALGISTETGDPWLDLAFGSSMGPYYYVFVITWLVLLTPLIGRLHPALRVALTLALVAAQWFVDAARGVQWILFWHYRSPLLWWGYFLVGWELRAHRDAVAAWLDARRRVVLPLLFGVIAALSALSAADLPDLWVRSAAWLNVYAIAAAIFALGCPAREPHPLIRSISDATYAIFLLHLFFVYAAQQVFPHAAGRADPAAIALPWLAGFAGPAVVIALARQWLGPRSRDWIGA